MMMMRLLVTATAGDTLTGNRPDLLPANQAVAGGTEWSRLFIAGEVLIFRPTILLSLLLVAAWALGDLTIGV